MAAFVCCRAVAIAKQECGDHRLCLHTQTDESARLNQYLFIIDLFWFTFFNGRCPGMADFTRFRTVPFNSSNSSYPSSTTETALPVLESPINPPSFVLSSIDSDSSLSSHGTLPKIPKHKHKLTKARAAALSISLNGTKVRVV